MNTITGMMLLDTTGVQGWIAARAGANIAAWFDCYPAHIAGEWA